MHIFTTHVPTCTCIYTNVLYVLELYETIEASSLMWLSWEHAVMEALQSKTYYSVATHYGGGTCHQQLSNL